MNDNLLKKEYVIENQNSIVKFYKKNKTSIFSIIFLLFIFFASFSYYFYSKEKKELFLSDRYIDAKIYLENGDNDKAIKILKEIILSNNKTYSPLSLFLLLDKKLINDNKQLSSMFEHILNNNKFEDEIKNLIIFKKVLFQSNFINESELLEATKPLINKETFWKPHALLLLGDYFVSKKEFFKAKEFYLQILSLKNLSRNIYEKAAFQLSLISDE